MPHDLLIRGGTLVDGSGTPTAVATLTSAPGLQVGLCERGVVRGVVRGAFCADLVRPGRLLRFGA